MESKQVERAIAAGELYRCSVQNLKERILIVFVPGWTFKPYHFQRLLLELLDEEGLEGSDLLPFRYSNHVTSREDPRRVASDLAARIDDAFSEREYDAIFLVGHSIGALLVREALLQAHQQGRVWVPAVRRLVLLAGTNRGFVPGTHLQRAGAYVASFLKATFNSSISRLIMEAQLGSEWVTSLRMRWLRTFSGGDAVPPQIVQLYGEKDLVVSADDALDISRYDNSAVERLPGVDHGGFRGLGKGNPAYERIVDAFFRELPKAGKPRTKDRKRLVFLIHGIRDFAEWQYALDYEIEKRDESIDVIPVQYGYFNVLQFLLPHQQSRAVRVFVDKYVEEVSLSPMAKIAVAAHSNGTRVLQQAVSANEFIRVDRAYFAGSVLPTDVPWGLPPYRERVGILRNVRATKDIPVGFLCRALEWVPVIGRGLGTAGYHGFRDGSVDNRVLDGGHGAALKTNHRDLVARYLVGDESLPEMAEVGEPPMWMRALSTIALAAVPVVFFMLYLAFAAIARTPDGYDVALSAVFTFTVLLILQRF